MPNVMPPSASFAVDLLPLVVYFAGVLVIAAVMLGGSYFLGQRHRGKGADEPFESGIVPAGGVHIRLSIPFYLLAIFFVIFDMEAVFLYAWSVALPEAGWPGFVAATIFIGVLLVTLAYLWRSGALEWRTSRQLEADRLAKE